MTSRPRSDRQLRQAAAPPLGFMEQNSHQTLREGLAEYFSGAPALMEPRNLPEDLEQGLHSHDVAHVVFGCDTSVRGEVVLARWSLFGIEGGLRPYLIGARRRETRGLFLDFFRSIRFSDFLGLVRAGATAVIRSLSMARRWPFDRYDSYLDRPLSSIREEFRIRVV